MQPVYLRISQRGIRHLTLVRKIQGDIWQMERDLRQFIEPRLKIRYPVIATKINEMSGQITIRGDHVALVKKWMDIKGF